MSPRPSQARELLVPLFTILLLLQLVSLPACRSGERRARGAASDTSRGAVSSSSGAGRAGINDYNRQREALGSLDSLVTPARPAVPAR